MSCQSHWQIDSLDAHLAKQAFGDRLKLVGDSLELGEWDVDRALDLSWSDGDIWKAQVELPPSTEVRFKVHVRPSQ